MNNYLKTMLLVVCLGLMAACSGEHQKKQPLLNLQKKVINNPKFGKWQKASKSPIKFTKTLTIGNRQNFILPIVRNLTGLIVDHSGNIYFYNQKTGKLYSFSPDGGLRWKTGQKGKGPGDFNNPTGFAVNSQYIFISNISGTRIDKYDLKGNYITSEPLGQTSTVQGIISDTLLVISSSIPGETGDKVTLLNMADSLGKIEQFKVVFKNSHIKFSGSFSDKIKSGITMAAPVQIKNSLIALTDPDNYIMQFYTIHGKKTKTITRQFNKLVPPMITGGVSKGFISVCYSHLGLKGPWLLQGNYYITTLAWPNVDDPVQYCKSGKKKNFKNAIDLFSSKGVLLYSLTTDGKYPVIGKIVYADTKGNIYTKTNKPFPQIRRYSVTIQPPGGE